MFLSLSTFLRRLCKLSLSLVLLWVLLVLLWLATPSPTPSYTSRPNAILQQADSNNALTVVYPTGKFFHWNDGKENVKKAYRDARWYFGMQFRVWVDKDSEEGEVIKMMLGGGEDPLMPWNDYNPFQSGVSQAPTNTTITLYSSSFSSSPSNSTSIIARAASDNSGEEEHELSLSPPIPLLLPNGDDDGINLPWFNKADSCLLFWWIHHENIEMPVRVRRVRAGEMEKELERVEIWADAAEWDSRRNGSPPIGLTPLLTITLPTAHEAFKPSLITYTLPIPPPGTETPLAHLPSHTYRFRLLVLFLLVPLSLLGMILFTPLSFVFHFLWAVVSLWVHLIAIVILVVVGVGAWWWWRNNRPPLVVVVKRGARFLEERGIRLSFDPAAARNFASSEEGEGEGEALVDLESGTPRAEAHTIASRGDGELVDVSVPETPGPKPTSVPVQAPAAREGNDNGNDGGPVPLVDVSPAASASPPVAATATGAGA